MRLDVGVFFFLMLTIKKIFTESVTISLWFFDCEACGILAP